MLFEKWPIEYIWLIRAHVDSIWTKKMQNVVSAKRAKGVIVKICEVFVSWLV